MFAFLGPAEEVEGKPGDGGCCVHDRGGVGEDGGAAGVSDEFVVGVAA